MNRMPLTVKIWLTAAAFLLLGFPLPAFPDDSVGPDSPSSEQVVWGLMDAGFTILSRNETSDSLSIEADFDQIADHTALTFKNWSDAQYAGLSALGFVKDVGKRDTDVPDRFAQRVFFTLRKPLGSRPVVLHTAGYMLSNGRLTEPAAQLGAHQVAVEHRFFGSSKPVTSDHPAVTQLLTAYQAAGDLHQIRTALNAIPPFQGAWLATGRSKGGMASVFYRFFFPSDTAAAVPYVAPLSHGLGDTRYVDFLQRVGDAPCRKAVRQIQKDFLENRGTMRQLAEAWSEAEATPFATHLHIDTLLDLTVSEFGFQFWQYGGLRKCNRIPLVRNGASLTEVFRFVTAAIPLSSVTEHAMADFEAYFFQAEQELGHPLLPVQHLLRQSLLTSDPNDYGVYLPHMKRPQYSPQLSLRLTEWLKTEATGLTFVYGSADPWTAGAFIAQGAQVPERNLFRYDVRGGDHGASIDDLPAENQEEIWRNLRAVLSLGTGPLPSRR